MRKYLFLVLIFPCLLRADWDQVLSNDEDPTLFHHVNVITGHLNLCLQDGAVEGAKPLPLLRTYTSAGALERAPGNPDLKLKELRGDWLIQGGWNIFPHTNLLIDGTFNQWEKIKVYLAEPGGSLIKYEYAKKSHHVLTLKPEWKGGQVSGIISAKNNPQNNRMEVYLGKGEITLFLPNGGRRCYKTLLTSESKKGFFNLTEEILPSGHRILYEYDKKDRLIHVALKNPAKNKTLAWIHFDLIKTSVPYQFRARTSCGKIFVYKAMEYKDREYLSEVESNCRFREILEYRTGRKGIGARTINMFFEGSVQFNVEYNEPSSHHEAEKWAESPSEVPLWADKVNKLRAPAGPNGGMIQVGQFAYYQPYTDVRDAHWTLTRFHHDTQKLTAIEYFDQGDKLSSVVKFFWHNKRVRCKALFSHQNELLFAKMFEYDEAGNVVEESFWGNLTGTNPHPLKIDDKGNVSGGECYRRKYAYMPHFNLPILEEEENGLSYVYRYKPDTDLVTVKLTRDKDKIVLRNFYVYNDDHFLLCEITDDGSGQESDDLTGVTYRQIKRYELDPNSCLVKSVTESYLDPQSYSEITLKKVVNTYSSENRIIEEAYYDAEGKHRYTIGTGYNAQGHIIRKTNPLGQENTYVYDIQGRLLKSQEVGSPQKIFTYDAVGRPTSCQEIDCYGNSKVSYAKYNAQGKIIEKIDTKGNAAQQYFDAFGRCTWTKFPPACDEEGKIYDPIVYFTYDVYGNLASHRAPNGELTQTFYNSLRKPLRVIQADGTEVFHFYHKNGTLAKTILPDKTEAHFSYDFFQRIISKHIYSAEGDLLSFESWKYDAFRLLSHTQPNGLTETFTYDCAGRKIAEEADGRQTRYVYDALGFMEQITKGEVTHVQVYDVGGRVLGQWDENGKGVRENEILFYYNEQNRKEKALRHTTQGLSTDLFVYDGEGRLTRHTDPYGSVHQFLYTEDVTNHLGQRVLQKTTIDPLGNLTCEIFDALNRLVLCEKKDPQGTTVSKEELFHDGSGNKICRISSVYDKNQLLRKIATAWEYDEMGRMVKQIESGKKVTLNHYDSKGRLIHQTLPNGITISWTFDGIDRLLERVSSDGTVHDQYIYDRGVDPVQMIDLVHGASVKRNYNLFRQVTEEFNPNGLNLRWEYDQVGRCTELTLPDTSSIAYIYHGAHLSRVQRYSRSKQHVYQHEYSQFDANGHVSEEKLIYDLGILTTERDLMERPLCQTSAWLDHSLAYGPSGLVTEINNSLFGHKSYQYDPLNQLVKEGDKEYYFDSLGNPSQLEVNDLNQLVTTSEGRIRYDPNGNPIEQKIGSDTVHHNYDALGRLISITHPQKRMVGLIYDPLSRLVSKTTYLYQDNQWVQEAHVAYLYDQEKEIGLMNQNGQLVQLKVLGIGIKEDRGAAIALELEGMVFAPLHDFNGNIIGLLNSQGQLVESYQIDAFGQEITSSAPLNPWRFCSKRSEEGLVFFGQRFYHPSWGRWLTPDPAGFLDSPNLYLYVLNNPLNRLDLFGLLSENVNSFTAKIEVGIQNIQKQAANKNTFVHGKFIDGDVYMDVLISVREINQLHFTQHELEIGKVNILDHFIDMMPEKGQVVGIVTFQNGMRVNWGEFQEMSESVYEKIPKNSLFMGIYTQDLGLEENFNSVGWIRIGHLNSPEICGTRQLMVAVAQNLHKINPELLWLDISHSKGGGLKVRAIEGMTPDQKALMKQHLYALTFGSVLPMPRDYAFYAINFYSEKDWATKGFGDVFNKSDYGIKFLPSVGGSKGRLFLDHAFMRRTYQTALGDNIKDIGIEYGFYNVSFR